MPDNRIEDLRRRVQKDPASIAFAQLAEELRRAGRNEEAVDVATEGLSHHPAYLSARVTLGRALLELGRLDEAAAEFEFVVRAAPDNLTAVRQLADIHQRRRQSTHESRSRQPDAPTPPVHAEEPPPPTPRTNAVPVSIEPVNVVAAPVAPTPEELVIAELESWLAVIDAGRLHRGTAHAR